MAVPSVAGWWINHNLRSQARQLLLWKCCLGNMFHLLALVIALLLMGWVGTQLGYKSYSMRGWDGIGWSPGCVRYGADKYIRCFKKACLNSQYGKVGRLKTTTYKFESTVPPLPLLPSVTFVFYSFYLVNCRSSRQVLGIFTQPHQCHNSRSEAQLSPQLLATHNCAAHGTFAR